jgi:hypothetical protein
MSIKKSNFYFENHFDIIRKEISFWQIIFERFYHQDNDNRQFFIRIYP